MLKEHIRNAETQDKQEELKRFEEKWANKCVEEAYAKDVEPELRRVAEEDDAGEAR
jgi:hypothetical protein